MTGIPKEQAVEALTLSGSLERTSARIVRSTNLEDATPHLDYLLNIKLRLSHYLLLLPVFKLPFELI